jgi:hypothetical protein
VVGQLAPGVSHAVSASPYWRPPMMLFVRMPRLPPYSTQATFMVRKRSSK